MRQLNYVLTIYTKEVRYLQFRTYYNLVTYHLKKIYTCSTYESNGLNIKKYITRSPKHHIMMQQPTNNIKTTSCLEYFVSLVACL